MASVTKPIFVIFIMFSILVLLFVNTPAIAARPISIGPGPLIPVRPCIKGQPCPVVPVPVPVPAQPPKRGCRKYYKCLPPAPNNDTTRPNTKTNN